MHRFTLRQLDYLIACIDHGSVAKAAVALRVSQPTVSAAIAKMESQLGVQLLLRHHSQGVSPSVSAQKILPTARALQAHATDLQAQIIHAGNDISGVLNLGSYITLAPAYLPGLIAKLATDFAGIDLQIHEGTQSDLIDGLYNGRLDMAMLYDLDLPSDLRTTPLAELSPYVALPPAHRFAKQPSVDLAALSREPMILLDVPPSRDYFLGLFKSQGLKPNIAYRSQSLELVRGMVGQGLGFSLLVTRPKSDLTYDGTSVITRPLSQNTPYSNIVLASLAGLRPTKLMQSFEKSAAGYFQTHIKSEPLVQGE